LGAILAFLPLAGRVLQVEDSLQRSDAILVFAGTFAERPLEACDLYHDGYAPIVVLTREAPDGGQAALARRAIAFEDRADLARSLLVRLGVPLSAIVTLNKPHDSTLDEARSFAGLVRSRGWRRVIVVTSKMHTRRARLALERELRGTDVTVLMRASRYDTADPAHWWRRRADVRSMVFELEKFLAYLVGVSG
jgi:uncharacterized SAM-binding protein YcdF (DUF218 family)